MRTVSVLIIGHHRDVADTAQRLLRLLSLLQATPFWPGPELAERLGVTVRTVRRDVERLRAMGYPIEAELGGAGGYRLGRGGALPPLLLDDDEAVAVAVGLHLATDDAATGTADTAIAALAKLEALLPARLRPRVAALMSMTLPMPAAGVPGVTGADLVTVAQACRASERLRFAYVDGRGRRSDRLVEPFRLVRTGRRWYLVARDVDRQAWRSYRVDRLADATPTGHRFHLVDPPDPVAFVGEGVSAAPYRHRARVVIDAPIAVVAERVPPTVATLEPTPDGRTELVTGAHELDHIALHLAVLDLAFTVIEPAALARRCRALGDRLLAAASAPAPGP
jgi:predicted DNA-binding transcriptional regulator YafY